MSFDCQCCVRGCLEPSMSRLPFCNYHLYEHSTCEVFGCLEKLPLQKRRCSNHHPEEPTKAQVAREREARYSRSGMEHAAE